MGRVAGGGHPVPIQGVAGVSAFLERFLVQCDEVAVPWEEGSYVVDWAVLVYFPVV